MVPAAMRSEIVAAAAEGRMGKTQLGRLGDLGHKKTPFSS